MVFEHDFESFPELTNSQLELLEFVSPHPQVTGDFSATVVKVVDGDTIHLNWQERDFTFPLRLLDIDAPELSESHGHSVRLWLEARILQREVHILIDPSNRVDKYGRLLGRVFDNGMDIGYEMLHLGLVVPFGLKAEGAVPDVHYWLKEGDF